MTTPPGYPPYDPNQPPPGQPQPGPGQPQYGQPQPGQPQYGQPPAQSGAPAPGGSAIKMNVQGSVLTSNMIPPTVTFDGFPVPIGYGEHVVPVPPGRHHIEASAQWLRTYGQAALDVDVAPGQVVDVFYAAPLHQFTSGSMGFTKQPRKGLGCFIVVLAIVVAIIIIAIVAGALSS